MKTVLCLMLALTVAGCAAQLDDQSCRNYGWIPGSDGYAHCRQSLDQQRRQAINDRILVQAARPAPQVPFYQMPTLASQRPAFTTTTCTPLGNSVVCNSY